MKNNLNFFDRLYDKYETKANIDFYETLSDEIITLIEKNTDNKIEGILDLCCGTGLLTNKLRKRYPEVNILGVDISEKMINIAKSKNLKSVDFKLYDANKIGEIDLKFDVITSNYGIQWLNKDVFKGINKILNPNGILVCSIPGFISGMIDIKKENAQFVGNMLFKIIVEISKKYEKLEDINYAKEIIKVWSNTLEYTKIKEAAKENGLNLIIEDVKNYELEYNSSEDLVESILNRGTFGDVCAHASLNFKEELINCTNKYASQYKNLKDENIAQFLIFRKEGGKNYA